MQNGVEVGTGRKPALAFSILIAISLVLGLAFMHPPRPTSDALRYIGYAINLHDHGVFGVTTGRAGQPSEPGSVHAPLYPAWIAAFIALDPGLGRSLKCVLQNSEPQAPCTHDFGLIVAAQLVLAGVFFGCVWLLASRLSGNVWIAWIAAFCAMLAKPPLQYANHFLTEAILLPLLALFIVFLTFAYQDRRPRWMLAAGAALGLAALTRPAYAYLFFTMAGALTIVALVKGRHTLLLACILFVVAYAVVVAPWMARNKLLFDRFALTTGYAGDILTQRVAYNRMTWGELGLSFLLWFPDIGDDLVRLVAPKENYVRLTWVGTGSFYGTIAPALYKQVVKDAGDPDQVVGHLLRTEILAHPVKHAFVTVPLAYRAVFISKYWGVVGLVCFIALVVGQIRKGDHRLLLLSAPIWFMVVFHALVSVSIPRYNLALIPFYAYAMAWVIHANGCRILAILRQRNTAR